MKRSQLNAVLLVVGLGLAVVVFLSQEKEKKGEPLTPLVASAVSKITLDHPGKPAITLEKRDGQWQLSAPVQAHAEAVEINGILALATMETKSTLDAAQVKLADLGLDPAQYRVTLNDVALDIGGTEPLQFRRYIKVGDKIALVDDPPSAALDADYSDLVDKSLLPPNAEIEHLSVPGIDSAKASELQQKTLAAAWKNARAMWTAMDEPAKDDAAKSETVRMTLKDGSALEFAVVERDPQFVLARHDLKVRYTLSKQLVNELLQLPQAQQPDAEKAASTSKSK